MANEREMTLGESRVRAGFNPSESEVVRNWKRNTAHLIDDCQSMKGATTDGTGEEARLWALAQTHYELACMYAVKAATS